MPPLQRPGSFRRVPIVSTRCVVLQTHAYSDTSKILRLMTREHGPRSAIARGVLRPRSRITGLLEPFAEGIATLYLKRDRDLHTLSDFELVRERQGLARDLRRYGGASVLCELVLRLAPEQPDEALYRVLSRGLDRLLDVPDGQVAATSLATIWELVGALGFSPTFDACQRCGSPVDGGATFDVHEGGLLCVRCRPGGARLGANEIAVLRDLARGITTPGRVTAQQLAPLVDFVRYHAAEGYRLRSLDFLFLSEPQ